MSQRAGRRGVEVAVVSSLLVATSVPGLAGDLVLEGKRLVQAHCGACHAVAAADESPLRPAPPLRELGVDYPPRFLAEALAEGIVTGHAEMPEFRFAPAQIDAIIAYLEHLRLTAAAGAPVPRRRPAE